MVVSHDELAMIVSGLRARRDDLLLAGLPESLERYQELIDRIEEFSENHVYSEYIVKGWY